MLCRIPDWWKEARRPPALKIKVGENSPSLVGFNALLDFCPEISLGGVSITPAELRRLAHESDGGASTETRSFTYALIEINGVKVNFISMHLGFPEYARVGQAKELIAYIKKLSDPVVVTGDFNMTQGSESYKVITAF